MNLNKIRNLDKYTKLAIIVILIGVFTRFALVVPYYVAGDACWHISSAKFMANNLRIPLYEHLGREQPFWPPPLFHIIAALFYKIFSIFGNNAAEFGIKLVSPLFGSLSLIFVYLILRKLFDEKVSLYATMFIAFLPISIDYGVFSYADSTLAFFVLASVYFALDNKILLSAFSLSLACLTKYTALFLFPVIFYIIFLKNRKLFLKKSIIALVVTGIITLPWYIRNWIYLKNPVYPVLNSLFGGVEIGATYSGFDLSRLFSLNTILVPFLETFGVPDGNPLNLTFFNLPFLSVILTIWFLAVFVFVIPVFFGLNMEKRNRNIAIIWFIPYAMAGILHIMNVGWSIARRILPAYASLAFYWGNGFNNIIKKTKHKKIIFILLTLIICGFVFVEFIKITLAATEWNFYKEDFKWVGENTEKGAIFMAGGQCLSYNLNKRTLNPSEENIENVDYIWVNQNFRLDKRSILDEDLLRKIEDNKFKIVYYNKKTKTRIYEIGQE